MDDLYLALLLWKEGRTRNTSGKAFSAVKALLSALVVNEDKPVNLAKDEKEKEWIKKKARTAPTHSTYAIARILKGVEVDLTDLVSYALNLYDYQYKGFEPGFSK